MRCEQAIHEELAEKYVAARLAEPLQEEFEVHVLECPRCRNQVERLQDLQADLARPASVPAPRAPFFAWPRWALSAVAALLLVGAAAVWFDQQRSEQSLPLTAGTTSPATVPTPNAAAPQPMPGNGRNYVDFSNNTGRPQKTAPEGKKRSTDPATTPGASAPEQPPQAASAAQPEAPEVARLEGEKPEAIPAGSAPGAPAAARGQLPNELAAELFRLGQADPPPYTFAGFNAGREEGPVPGGQKMGVRPPSAQVGRRHVFASAMAAYIEGRYAAALPLLEQAVEAEPAAPDTRFFLAACRLLLGRPKEAATVFTQAIQLGPSLYLEGAHFYLAKAYIQMNQLAEAEDELQATVAIQGRLSVEAASLRARLQAVRSALKKPASTQPAGEKAKPE